MIADERDVRKLLGDDTFRSFYIVAQENLELVTNPAESVICHPYMMTLFYGYNFATGTFNVPHMYRYCFPSVESGKAETSEESAAVEAVYAKIDEILIEVRSLLKESFSKCRTNEATLYQKQQNNEPEGQHQNVQTVGTEPTRNSASNAGVSSVPVLNMQDLMVMLKFAPTSTDALNVEKLLWLIWISHANPEINKLMRLSISHANRGNLKKAVEIVNRVIELDPTFAEAFHKRAWCQEKLGEIDDSCVSAQKTVEIWPQHFGALASLAKCYRRNGKH